MVGFIAEFLGVMFLVLVAGLSGDPLAIGVALAILLYAAEPLSGAYLNPSVAISQFMDKKLKGSTAINYIIAQVAGAIVGALLVWVFRGSTMAIMPADGIGTGMNIWKSGLAEFIFTYLLCMVVFMTTAYRKAANNSYWGLAIGLTVFIGAMAVGRLSGGAFNPAVATGSALVDWIHGGSSISYLLMYLIATLLGGVVAGWTARAFRHEEKEHNL